MSLIGIDGCRGGWLCVADTDGVLGAAIVPTLAAILDAHRPRVVVIDIPIGLAERGPRRCDALARRALAPTRASSVFPAPVRGALGHPTYEATCAAHRAIDGRALSKQAWCILPKIAEVDALLQRRPEWRGPVHEGHPELSFATWNHGVPLRHGKRTPEGRVERRALIEARWPGAVDRLTPALPPGAWAADDLLDAFAVLWTAHRIAAGEAVRRPEPPDLDGTGLRMAITA
ncbi:hypothetical protein TBR22_A42440 [Luteitalea sp. TBR-22]|uniref:DUF429 domain-containing protein n=1 Tax=Luteitalea sp. TBR-22 TaxID=2802971 RepID=UPI001AF7AF4A|nr:DUF429 domain-containing protein [Luteitalea sp. TBR-22]BCS35018.1 hypothetical protein TBR22_A42440 [Luteitalea sp. TBR-22]